MWPTMPHRLEIVWWELSTSLDGTMWQNSYAIPNVSLLQRASVAEESKSDVDQQFHIVCNNNFKQHADTTLTPYQLTI